jgi:hypothetical protein
MGEFQAPRNEFLVFEEGPSVDVTLQWATYADAADECSLSRIYGGIHPPADDIPGRFMGAAIAPEALAKALSYFDASESIDIDRGRARPRRKGRGRVTSRGSIAPEVGADQPVDIANQVVVSLGCGPGLLEVRSFAPADWKHRKQGRLVCRSLDGSAKLVLRPSKSVAGGFTYRVDIDLPTYATPVTGPLSLQIRNGDVVHTGTSAACTVNAKGTKLTCRD